MEAGRHDVIMAGIGGKGVLMAGEFLARAGLKKYEYISWFPTYFSSKRGGAVECTVVLSDVKIASPIVTHVNFLLVMDQSQLVSLENRVKPGGTILIESANLKAKVSRNDVNLVEVPAMETALKLGSMQMANMVLLGAYVQFTGAIPLELALEQVEERFVGKEAVMAVNKRAVKEGANIIGARGKKSFEEGRLA